MGMFRSPFSLLNKDIHSHETSKPMAHLKSAKTTLDKEYTFYLI